MTKKSIGLIFCSIIATCGISFAANGSYPQQIGIIDKTQADYFSPENTLSAIRSCLLAENLDWCDETMTLESLQEDIKLFEEAGKNRNQIFELEKNVRESFIVNKLSFKDAVLLIVEDYDYDGSVMQIPMPFVKEEGLWKITNKYSSDEEIHQHFYYVPPLFDGKGQRPTDVNIFLGYEQPTVVRTELTPGIDKYTLHIYYGKTIDPATFMAVLNKQDISLRFTPKPFSDQEVELSLQQGRNVLVLSVNGTRKDGRKAKDTDRLVFIVP
jgi:hypothetical protein